ncbi:hypothetical protein BCR43DRAFT_564586 [Syncephalastrum racemosum]|uniref:Uncharacterized protein n=1 Tax=Syncephalastrum racemosum TaxID=13706 RepID=A0A1X2HAY2_SYNRA|nr:hypothetical protein BCR43DRAFT_564586 [Syncephalastrum racemosum]
MATKKAPIRTPRTSGSRHTHAQADPPKKNDLEKPTPQNKATAIPHRAPSPTMRDTFTPSHYMNRLTLASDYSRKKKEFRLGMPTNFEEKMTKAIASDEQSQAKLDKHPNLHMAIRKEKKIEFRSTSHTQDMSDMNLCRGSSYGSDEGASLLGAASSPESWKTSSPEVESLDDMLLSPLYNKHSAKGKEPVRGGLQRGFDDLDMQENDDDHGGVLDHTLLWTQQIYENEMPVEDQNADEDIFAYPFGDDDYEENRAPSDYREFIARKGVTKRRSRTNASDASSSPRIPLQELSLEDLEDPYDNMKKKGKDPDVLYSTVVPPPEESAAFPASSSGSSGSSAHHAHSPWDSTSGPSNTPSSSILSFSTTRHTSRPIAINHASSSASSSSSTSSSSSNPPLSTSPSSDSGTPSTSPRGTSVLGKRTIRSISSITARKCPKGKAPAQ